MSRAHLRLISLFGLLLCTSFSPLPALSGELSLEPVARLEVDASFRDYYEHRGGARTIGLPLAAAATVNGKLTQLFQRRVLQLDTSGAVHPLNLADLDLPLDTVNGSILPPLDQSLADLAPAVGEADYHAKALQFVRQHVPDEWNGLPVRFLSTFTSSVRPEEAATNGRVEAGVLEGFDLELWGLPTSPPAADPANSGFVYQRFQRGVMHYDSICDCTQGMLIGDKLLALFPLPPRPEPTAPGGVAQAGVPATGAAPAPLNQPIQTAGISQRRPVVVVDPGHGGRESGAMRELTDGSTLYEKDLTLRIASRLIPLLSNGGFVPIPTRTADRGVARLNIAPEEGRSRVSEDLQARVDLANTARADLLLSIHINAAENPSAKGVEVVYSENRPQSARSRAFADLANKALVQALRAAGYPAKERKVVTDSAVLGGEGHFYLLGPTSEAIRRASEMPAVIGETLYLSNDDDLGALIQPTIQDAIARGYFEAITQFFRRFPVG